MSLVSTVVSAPHCGCGNLGSIPRLDSFLDDAVSDIFLFPLRSLLIVFTPTSTSNNTVFILFVSCAVKLFDEAISDALLVPQIIYLHQTQNFICFSRCKTFWLTLLVVFMSSSVFRFWLDFSSCKTGSIKPSNIVKGVDSDNATSPVMCTNGYV